MANSSIPNASTPNSEVIAGRIVFTYAVMAIDKDAGNDPIKRLVFAGMFVNSQTMKDLEHSPAGTRMLAERFGEAVHSLKDKTLVCSIDGSCAEVYQYLGDSRSVLVGYIFQFNPKFHPVNSGVTAWLNIR